MKQIAILINLFMILHLTALGFEYPEISITAKSLNDFVPKNWKLLKSSKGDINNDKIIDLVFVLEYTDNATITRSSKDFNGNQIIDSLDSKPRILVITTFDPAKGYYRKIEQSNLFIPCEYEGGGQNSDIFEGLIIRNQLIVITIYSMSGVHSQTNYKFKIVNNEVVLVGYEESTTYRISGDFEELIFYFKSKKVKIVTGNVESKKQEISWKTLHLPPKLRLKDFSNPFSMRVEGENSFNISLD